MAWSLAFIAVLLEAASMLVGFLRGQPSDSLAEGVGSVVVIVGTAVIGAAVASRVPRNPLGWLLLGLALINPIFGLIDSFLVISAARVQAGQPALPGTMTGLLLSALLLAIVLTAPLTFIPLLFPDGRLLSHRWRVVGWAAIAGMSLWTAAGWIQAFMWPEEALTSTDGSTSSAPVVDVLAAAGLILAVAACLASLASLVVRWRRARGAERQQLKWLVVGIAAALAGVLAETDPLDSLLAAGWSGLPDFIGDVSGLALPLSVGIAVTRYRLYEIDRLINRTVVYTVVTGLLLITYFAIVGGLQVVLAPLGDTQLAVAASTLAVAAAFQPLRRVVQRRIDSRFNRSRYDARRIIDTFQTSLRDEVDLEVLRRDLHAAATTTMHPTHVLLWLAHRTPQPTPHRGGQPRMAAGSAAGD